MNKAFVFFLFLALIPTSLNLVSAEGIKEQSIKQSYTKEQALLEEQSHRQLWALSKSDWTRYKTLMRGIRGSISPKNISPIEVLGTHARNDAERRKYAELWARMRHDDVTRILAFQSAYNEAFARLYPNEQMINTKLLTALETQYKPGNRVLVFLKIDQCAECKEIIQTVLMDDAVKTLHVDIYFVDTKNKRDDNKIRQWAKQQNIDAQRLKSGNITLNHDKGTLFRLTKKIVSAVPLVFSMNSTELTQIHY